MPIRTLVLVAIAVATLSEARANPTPAEKPKATVFTSVARIQELHDQLLYPARVVSTVNSAILADGDGIVSSIHAPLGQKVSRRGKILTIRNQDPVYQYAPIQVVSPADGIVSSIEVSEGSHVTKGQKVALVTDPSKSKVIVEVPALDLPSIQKGMQGEFVPTGSDKPISVRVRGVSPFVDPATGTSTCELELVQAAPGTKSAAGSQPAATATPLLPGVLGQASFKANSRKGFLIPEHAVLYKGADTFLRVVQDGKAKQVAVTLGRKSRGMIEILKGLNDGDTLVERASRYVTDSEAVEVQAPKSEEKAGK